MTGKFLRRGLLGCFAVQAIAAGFASGFPARADKKTSQAAQSEEGQSDGSKKTDPQKEAHFEGQVTITVELNYLVYLPPEYASGDQHWPLLLFLHGSGERGTDIDEVKTHGPPKLIAEGKQFPFIVVSPQAPRRRWVPEALAALLDDVMRKYRVDKDRVYLTGLSMGGSGTWALAAAVPDKFAAIAPICGSGDPVEAKALKDVPVWVFHGAEDESVPVKRSEEMVKALQEAGAKEVKFTVYPDVGHDAWTDAYNDPELYHWLLSHRLSERK
jgi:predicted peptidase